MNFVRACSNVCVRVFEFWFQLHVNMDELQGQFVIKLFLKRVRNAGTTFSVQLRVRKT